MSLTPEMISGLSNFPAGAPPPGVTANFDNPPSNAQAIYISAGLCIAFIVFAAGCRIFSKIGMNRSITWADGVLLFSATGVISWMVMVVVAISGKTFSRHIWDIKLGFFRKQDLVLSWLTILLYPVWLLSIKISLLLLYLEIFGSKRWLRYWTYGGMVALAGCHLSFSIVWVAECSPQYGTSTASWLLTFTKPECAGARTYIILQNVFNLLSDAFLMILPLPAVWSLQMQRKKKLGVSAMFLTGFCALVAGIVSLDFRLKLLNDRDSTWRCVYNWIGSILEMTAGLLVVCMPAIAVAIRRGLPLRKINLSAVLKRSDASPTSSGVPAMTDHGPPQEYSEVSQVSGGSVWAEENVTDQEKGARASYIHSEPLQQEAANRTWAHSSRDDISSLRPVEDQATTKLQSVNIHTIED